MKARISLCNGMLLKKDLTRFAPVMLLTALVLWAVGSVLKTDLLYLDPGELPETAQVGVIPAMLLSALSAFNLFTYLTKKQECDAIHALPLRRETLLCTKLIAALIQFFVPFGIFYLFFPGDRGWGFQMSVTFCCWLYEFALVTLIMMLVGRRLAGFMLYLMVLVLEPTVLEVLKRLYLPLLPGVFVREDALNLSPFSRVLWVNFDETTWSRLLPELVRCVIPALILLALALVVYRRRKLERAGDFLTVRWLEPVLAWWMAICAALVTISISDVVQGSLWVALPIGLTIGYFAARMFFARSVKVFDRKTLLGWLILLLSMGASLAVTFLDPLGLVDRIPRTGQIESVTLYDGDYFLYSNDDYMLRENGYRTEVPEQIDEVRRIHGNLLSDDYREGYEIYGDCYYLVYELKNGSEIIRGYADPDGETLERIEFFLSQPQSLLGSGDIEYLLKDLTEIRVFGMSKGQIYTQRDFLEIFLPECEAGLMYTADYTEYSSWEIQIYSESFGFKRIPIPKTAEKTIDWLEAYFRDLD